MDGIQRVFAIVERELRRLRRSPMLIVMSLIMPLMQLLILGHAFGGAVKNLKVGLIDQDHGLQAVRLRELSNAIANGNRTFELIPYTDPGVALTALRNGDLSGVLTVPEGFSRRTLEGESPHVALVVDNTDNFTAATLMGSTSSMLGAYAKPAVDVRRMSPQPTLDVVEVYPF